MRPHVWAARSAAGRAGRRTACRTAPRRGSTASSGATKRVRSSAVISERRGLGLTGCIQSGITRSAPRYFCAGARRRRARSLDFSTPWPRCGRSLAVRVEENGHRQPPRCAGAGRPVEIAVRVGHEGVAPPCSASPAEGRRRAGVEEVDADDTSRRRLARRVAARSRHLLAARTAPGGPEVHDHRARGGPPGRRRGRHRGRAGSRAGIPADGSVDGTFGQSGMSGSASWYATGRGCRRRQRRPGEVPEVGAWSESSASDATSSEDRRS
jgi:hypothetical protein